MVIDMCHDNGAQTAIIHIIKDFHLRSLKYLCPVNHVIRTAKQLVNALTENQKMKRFKSFTDHINQNNVLVAHTAKHIKIP